MDIFIGAVADFYRNSKDILIEQNINSNTRENAFIAGYPAMKAFCMPTTNVLLFFGFWLISTLDYDTIHIVVFMISEELDLEENSNG